MMLPSIGTFAVPWDASAPQMHWPDTVFFIMVAFLSKTCLVYHSKQEGIGAIQI